MQSISQTLINQIIFSTASQKGWFLRAIKILSVPYNLDCLSAKSVQLIQKPIKFPNVKPDRGPKGFGNNLAVW